MVKLPAKPSARSYADVHVVGIPRSLLYYRYGELWKTFFEALGRTVVISEETDKALVDAGTFASVDECCLASKAFMGHAISLIDRCDALFIPCYGSKNPRAGFCTKFQSLPDLAANTLRDQKTRIMSMLVEDSSDKKSTQSAFLGLAAQMGASQKEAKRAWKEAAHAQDALDAKNAATQEETLRLLAEYRRVMKKDTSKADRPLAILLVAHPYIAHDRYISGAIVDALKDMGATIIYADETNHAKAYKASFDFSQTLPWTINRELIGSILMLRDKVDGIVLVSAFPCGPDSMTDDAVMRCIQGKPILNLMIDAQSGTAGVQTRVESFVDILRFQQKGGYVDVGR